MANRFHLPFLPELPLKESLDYIKNVTFCVGLQALAMTIASPHNGHPSAWWWKIFAALVIIPVGIFSAMCAQLYIENWPDLSPKRRWAFTWANVGVVFLAGMATKIRLAEGW